MGTFSAFTCEPSLGGSPEWDRAYQYALRRSGGVGRLSGLGADAPTLTVEEQRCYEQSRSRVGRESAGMADEMLWIGTFIAPKADKMGRFMLIDARWVRDDYSMSSVKLLRPGPTRGIAALGSREELLFLGEVGYDGRREIGRNEPATYSWINDGGAMVETQYRRDPSTGRSVPVNVPLLDADGQPMRRGSGASWSHPRLAAMGMERGHSPGGVRIKGLGHGAIGYAAAALGAMTYHKQQGAPQNPDGSYKAVTGLYSIDTTRTDEATTLWASAAKESSGPLSVKVELPMAMENGRIVRQRLTFGYDGHCPTELLTGTSGRDANGCRTGNIVCNPPQRKTYIDTVPAYYIDLKGVMRWGLTVFAPFPVPRGGGSIPKRYQFPDTVREEVRRGGLSSRWDLDSVRRAFGVRATQDRAFDMRSALKISGAERLKNAEVGPSIPLYTKLCGVMQGYEGGEQWVIEFLSRSDIGSVLRADPAGKVLLESYGLGTELAGLSAAAWRDIHRAVRTERSPLDLNLAPLSRETQREVDAYPDPT